jgi:putative flippase GtrA
MFNLANHLWTFPFFRFLVVGALNTAVGYGLFAVLILFHVDYKIAILLATVLGALFNFKSTGPIVFNNRKNNLIFKFGFVYGIVYLVNLYTVDVFVGKGLPVLLSQAFALPLVVVLSFFLQKTIVFGIKHHGR